MRLRRTFTVLSIASFAIASAAIAFEPESGSTTKPTMKEKPVRLTTPWNKVKDLTDDQKKQINEIHVETIARIRGLEAEEDEKCMALLTDEQRKALEETLEQEKADRKAKAGKKE